MEPGEDPLAVTAETFVAATRGSALVIECWDTARNVTRRVTGIRLERPGRLELEIERFGGRAGILSLIDMGRAANHEAIRRGTRLKYRERFRSPCIASSRSGASPNSALNRIWSAAFRPAIRGSSPERANRLAAIGVPDDAVEPEEALTFGLIWLDHSRHRERRLVVEGLAIFVPAGVEASTRHRVRYLNRAAAQFLVYIHETRPFIQAAGSSA